MTHLNVDHVGWNARLAGEGRTPTFPNTRHLFSRREFEFFTDPANAKEIEIQARGVGRNR
jgi:hypothetical protein